MLGLQKSGLILGTLLVCAAAHAEIYKSVDRHGNVTYTDQPGKSAKPVDLPGINSIPTVESPAVTPETAEPNTSASELAVRYKSVRIIKPADDTGIGHGPGNFTVQARTRPELQKTHALQLYMDGKAYGKANTSGTFALSNVDRGTHELAVKVVDTSGKTLKSSKPVTVHVFRPSVLQPAY